MRRVVFVQGGGIGFDQEQSVRRILSSAGLQIDWQVFPAGWAAVSQGLPVLPDELVKAIRQTGVALKTKLLPAPTSVSNHAAPANANVLFRKTLGLFATVRPIHNLAGVSSRFHDINFTMVREITEDLYATTEHEIVPGIVQSFKIVTESACMKFFKFSFELARRLGKKSIHCIHKANILKMADGLYLECFRKVAKGYPEITPKELIVDNACMQLVSKPHQFEMLACGNLYGDLLSDLGAGLVGGKSCTAGINYGDDIRVYEAIYGGTRETVGADKANPLPLILPAIEMIREWGDTETAQRIHTAVERVLSSTSIRTADIGGSSTTTQFTDAIIQAL